MRHPINMGLLALTIALAIALAAIIISPPKLQQAPPNNSGQPTQSEQQDRSGPQSGGTLGSQEGKDKSRKERTWYSTFIDHPTEWLLAVFTGILAIYTARLFHATSGLVEAASEQSRDMKTSLVTAATAAAASQKAAEAAEKSANAIPAIERGYVFAKPRMYWGQASRRMVSTTRHHGTTSR